MIVPEEGEVPQKVDIRLVVGSNRDLPAHRLGKFLPDLYHRLPTLRVSVPPLRKRSEDIDALIERTLTDLTSQGHVSGIKKKDWTQLKALRMARNCPPVDQSDPTSRLFIHVRERSLDGGIGLGGLAPELGDGNAINPCPLWPLTSHDVLPMEQVRKIYAKRALELFSTTIPPPDEHWESLTTILFTGLPSKISHLS